MSHKELQTRRKRKSIDKDVEVVISNNTYGMFVWESKNGETSLSMEEHGDEEFITYGELRRLKKYLENMELIITEVNDDDVTIMDVARGLRVDDIYEQFFEYVEDLQEDEFDEEDMIDIDDFEDFILNSDIEDFKDAMKTGLKHAIVDISVELYKEKKLADHAKTQVIRKSRPKEEQSDFWSDIDASFED